MSHKNIHVREDMVAVAQTDKALGVCHVDDDRNGELTWIPWDYIRSESTVQIPGDEGRLVVTRWIAVQKGWADHPDPHSQMSPSQYKHGRPKDY